MSESIAIENFKALASEAIRELEAAIHRGDTRYYNAEIALQNVRRWLALAKAGTLPGSYRPDFGISRSGLTFGPIEGCMYRLEQIYVDHIVDPPQHAP